MVIRKIGKRKWRLYSSETHKNLGTFHSLRAVKAREKQIQFFKYRSRHPYSIKRRAK